MNSRNRSTRLVRVLGTVLVPLAPMLLTPSVHAANARCFGEEATIVADGGLVTGTRGPDVIVATDPATEVHAVGGDDRICGAFLVYGGAGDDRIHYGGRSTSEFELNGGPGNDRIFVTGAVFGSLIGGPGDDRLAGRAGEQWVSGGTGLDTITGGSGPDTLIGGPGADVVRGNDGPDDLSGHRGDDRLYGGNGDDELSGGGGRDAGFGGPGRDTCHHSTERAVSCRR